MDIKRKHVIFEPEKKKNLFLDISFTNIDKHVPSLYQSVETRSIKAFWLLSQPLPHFHFNIFVVRETFLETDANCFTWETIPTVNRKYFFMNTLCMESFCPQKTHNNNAALW
jgi:hypothetical protein